MVNKERIQWEETMMYMLHLIINNNCKHSVFVEENKRSEAIPAAMSALTLEAGNQRAEVIVCNEQNMPLGYHSINESYDGIHQVNKFMWVALVGFMLAMILPWYLS